jgi:hypothetical protein
MDPTHDDGTVMNGAPCGNDKPKGDGGSLRRSNKAGSIAPGKWADIIAVDGDPLKDVRFWNMSDL